MIMPLFFAKITKFVTMRNISIFQNHTKRLYYEICIKQKDFIMKYVSKFLALLLLSIPSSLYTASSESPPIHQYRISCTSVFHPKTGAFIPGYTKSEFHQCEALSDAGMKLKPSAKIIVYQRADGSIVSDEVIEYPHPEIGKILDAFHKAPADERKFPILAINEYKKTLEIDSEEECRAKLAMYQVLYPAIPQATNMIITWEKQHDATQSLADLLFAKAESDEKHKTAALKAQSTARNIQSRLDIVYKGFGSIKFKNAGQKNEAIALGRQLVLKINQRINPMIEAAKLEEKRRTELK